MMAVADIAKLSRVGTMTCSARVRAKLMFIWRIHDDAACWASFDANIDAKTFSRGIGMHHECSVTLLVAIAEKSSFGESLGLSDTRTMR